MGGDQVQSVGLAVVSDAAIVRAALGVGVGVVRIRSDLLV